MSVLFSASEKYFASSSVRSASYFIVIINVSFATNSKIPANLKYSLSTSYLLLQVLMQSKMFPRNIQAYLHFIISLLLVCLRCLQCFRYGEILTAVPGSYFRRMHFAVLFQCLRWFFDNFFRKNSIQLLRDLSSQAPRGLTPTY